MKTKSAQGFSMIELLIVIVIIGILASIATTSYQTSIRKARRADAKGTLLELAQLMERNFTETLNYGVDPLGVALTLGTNIGFTTSPNTGGTAYYNLSFNPAPTATTYTLRAVPVPPQDKDTRCMTLTLDNTGSTGIIGGSGTAAECWAR